VSRRPEWKAPTVPRPYPPEFRARAIALVRSGKQVKQTAYELGISAGCLHEWLKQDLIDHGVLPGKSTAESAELRAARKRIRDLESELAIVRAAAAFLDRGKSHPKESTR
jgi:transposase